MENKNMYCCPRKDAKAQRNNNIKKPLRLGALAREK